LLSPPLASLPDLSYSFQPHAETKILWVLFSSIEVGVGSCFEGEDEHGNQKAIFVALLRTHNSLLICDGYELVKRENDLMSLGCVCSIAFTFITNVFILYPQKRKEERSFWPYFIRFIADVSDPSPNALLLSMSLPYQSPFSLQMSFPHQIGSFLDELLKKIHHHLHSRSRGEKQLLCYNSTFYHHLLSIFGIDIFESGSGRVIKKIEEGNFPILSSFLGKYYFRSESPNDYAQSGWGFYHEPSCNHYITQVIAIFSKSGKELKVSAHFLLQNPKSLEFQTVGK
jgi:hypothetical protein